MGKIEINSLDNKVYVDTVEKIDLNVFDQRNSLLFKGNLATAQDLNNYIIPGIYHQESNAFAADGLNYPAPYAGVLEVTAGDGMVYQKYHSYREQEAFYYRSKYTTSWSAWTQVASKVYADTKQPTLVSGTNIKTVNSTSLLGSGNVAVQPTLVSGTNIKTVNSTSLLGSGNVEVQPTLVSGTNIKTVNSVSLLGSGDISTSTFGTNYVYTGKAANGTVYQNNTNIYRVIYISYNDISYIHVSSDNVNWVNVVTGSSDNSTLTVIIPPNNYYRVAGNIYQWVELI